MSPTKVEKQERQEAVKDTSQLCYHLWRCTMEDEKNLSAKEIEIRKAVEQDKVKMETIFNCFRLKNDISKGGGDISEDLLKRLTENDIIDINSARNYQIGVIQNIQKVYNPARIEELEDGFNKFPEDDVYFKSLKEIYDSGALNLPEVDSDNFAESINKHKYFSIDKATGIVRVSSNVVRNDLALIDNLEPTADKENNPRYNLPSQAPETLAKFRSFLSELMVADKIDYLINVQYPATKEALTPQSVKDATGALRALGALLTTTLGTISLIIERNKPFPTVAAMYFGATAMIVKPDMFTGKQINTLRNQLGFITPFSAEEDKWKEMLTNGFLSHMDENGRQALFTLLTESRVQIKSSQVVKGNISYKDYFNYLREEIGLDNKNSIEIMEAEQKTNPEAIKNLLRNTAQIKDSTAKTAMILFAKEGMTADKCANDIAKVVKPQKPPEKKIPLGGKMELNLKDS